MPIDAAKADLLVGIVGTGAMGRGIAQVAAAGGVNVRLFDTNATQSIDAVAFIERMLGRAAERGDMTAADVTAAMGRIETVSNLEEITPCDIVIEAVTENVEVKRSVFAQLERVLAEDTIIASNTSSLSVTMLASSCRRPERIAGMHFFNPVPLMRLVEVIEGMLTEPWVGDALMTLGRRLTREPVRLKDTPGFLVNQVGRGYNIESQHIQAEGVASFADIDRILREGAGFRMGPFELLDLTGLDVTHPATELIYEQLYHEPRFRPSAIMQARLQAGLLGRKTGRGYYEYEDGRQVVSAEPAPPAYDGRAVWVSRDDPQGHDALRAVLTNLKAPLDEGESPGVGSLILVTPVGEDVSMASTRQRLDPKRAVGVDTLFGLDSRRTLMTSPATLQEYRDAAHGLLSSDGIKATLIRDCPGFIAQRVIAMICNIGCQIAQSGAAAPEDIDRAVVLGLNYPSGPLAFGDALGAATVLRILDGLFVFYGDPRYRASPWLRRRAMLGMSLLAVEA
ncbi:MAG TPA: 3-hydroxyacyl-CoA dehydrogenase [Dehalococcoidia bacterium]|nr:3-hydroxyacyl-CoA dehydrogenase [Dehalococcoidia bacterium]